MSTLFLTFSNYFFCPEAIPKVGQVHFFLNILFFVGALQVLVL